MNYVKVDQIVQEKLISFFETHWGSPKMVISSGVYECNQLPGFACISDEGDIIGLVTYVDRGTEREIISLDAIVEKQGIGSNLMELVEEEARQTKVKKMTLVTSNDNIYALKFYQKRGYRMTKIMLDAVDQARMIKPEIPHIGFHGIPIKDEIVLEKELTDC